MSGFLANASGASPLSMQPTIGVSTEYASNPYLLAAGARAVSDAALLLSDPILYDLDSTHFTLAPSVRYSDSGSYASLNSNYVHINGGAQFGDDLDTLSLSASFGRDSSLYQNGLTSGGVGVRSDVSTSGIDWLRAITERLQFELDASWARVLYDQSATSEGLFDYRYLSEGSVLSYDLTERDKIKVLGGAGQYLALDGATKSSNLNLQVGWQRRLTEIWKFSASVGYARSNNIAYFFSGPYLLGTVTSVQKGPVYNASAVREGEKFTLTASASRAFRPSGFEFLSRQDTAELNVSYTLSERWSFGAKGDFTRAATPQFNGPQVTQQYFSETTSVSWHWTPTWVLSLQATWVNVKYDLPPLSADSSGVALQISRQFLRMDL